MKRTSPMRRLATCSPASKTSSVDSYFCRISCGDDCLGVVESYSSYFLERPRLELLDIENYGPSNWYVRNKKPKPLSLT